MYNIIGPVEVKIISSREVILSDQGWSVVWYLANNFSPSFIFDKKSRRRTNTVRTRMGLTNFIFNKKLSLMNRVLQAGK